MIEIKIIAAKILKAFLAFEKSLVRVSMLATNPEELSDEEQERWEAYTSRFSRLQDMLIKRYFRTKAMTGDPAWSGTVRDLLNLMEKDGTISASSEWMALRELRNEMAHEYSDLALSSLYERSRAAAPTVLAVKEKVVADASK